MSTQVQKDAYDFGKYSYPERWGSYYYQVRETLNLKPAEILEIGVGDGVFGDYIKRNTPIRYQSLDIAADLKPDIVGEISSMPLPDDSFGLVAAFEVLEHLPFWNFEKALGEIARVSKRYVVLSIPHFGPPFRFSLKIPFLGELRFFLKLPYPRSHVFNGQHYWEIGKRGYSVGKLRKIIGRRFKIMKEFVPWESPYHRFYVLEVRKAF